jgi:hypothetical protein
LTDQICAFAANLTETTLRLREVDTDVVILDADLAGERAADIHPLGLLGGMLAPVPGRE